MSCYHYVIAEVRSNRELCMAALLVCDCFVPRNDKVFNLTTPITNYGIACGPGCTLIRLQALRTGRYPLPSLMQGTGNKFVDASLESAARWINLCPITTK